MTKKFLYAALLAGSVIAAPALADVSTTVFMKDAGGKDVGTVQLQQPNDDLILIRVDVKNLPPGWHGFHIHETADCSANDFTSAGAHFNPEDDQHGAMAHSDFHAGDLPNIYVHEDGTARVDIFSEDLSLLNDDDGFLRDADGSAFMIHADADDYISADTGKAGARIACGEVR